MVFVRRKGLNQGCFQLDDNDVQWVCGAGHVRSVGSCVKTVSQGVVVHRSVCVCVCVCVWLGSQLTEQVN